MVTNIKDFEVMGSSRRCLVLNIEGRPTFCSTSNYAYLCMRPDTRWDVVKRDAHEGTRQGFKNGRVADVPAFFPESHWVQVYKPTLF